VNDRVLADLAGDGDAPPRGERGSTVRAALPLDIPRSPSHDELWDRDAAGQAQPKDAVEPRDAVEPEAGTGAEQPESIPSDVVSEALAAYAHPAEESVALPTPATPIVATPSAPSVATPAALSNVRAQELGEDGPGRLVRPYAMTGGRTRSSGAEIPLEALVIVTDEGRQRAMGLAWEQRAIAELCASPMSVAEVSAHLKVPLGVARVLVGDMAAEGLVEMSGASGSEQAPNDLNLLERVLNGLRAL
jgi:hypothetical protein